MGVVAGSRAQTLTNALDDPDLEWPPGGDAPAWFGQTLTNHDGFDAAQSGAITNGQTNWIQTTVEGPGILSFWWKVSCDYGDGLEFDMDGVLQSAMNSIQDWRQERFLIPDGHHTFRWSYRKDSYDYDAYSLYADAAWVDAVSFTHTTAPAFFVAPPDHTVLWGETVSLDCVVSGIEPFSYQWRSNAVPLDGQTNAAFTLDYARTNDNAFYSLVVANNFGSVTSAPAKLLVLNLEAEWQRTLGGDDYDTPSRLELLPGGGLVVAGSSDSLINGTKTTTNYGRSDVWLARLNAAGEPVWDRDFGDMSTDDAYALCVPTNGDCVLAGASYRPYMGILVGNKTSTNYGANDGWVVRVGAMTNKIWDLSFGGSESDCFGSVRQTADGGFILCGYSSSSADGNKTSTNFGGSDFWVVRLDNTGAIQWDRSFGGTNSDYTQDVWETSDGGFLVGGYSSSPAGGNKTSTNYGGADAWLVRLDRDGNWLWDKSYGGTGSDSLQSLCPTADGGCVFAGGSSSIELSGNKTAPLRGSSDICVVRVKANAAIEWQQTLGGTESQNVREIIPATGGGCWIAGSSSSGLGSGKSSPAFGNSDGWLERLDASGQQMWDYSFGGDSSDGLCGVRETADGGLVLAGSSQSLPGGNKFSPELGNSDFWVIKLGPPTLAPKVVQQPEGLRVLAGTNVVFNTRVRGTPPLGCQWYHDGTRLSDGTNASLALSGVGAGDAGDYWLVVTSAYSPPATSHVATLEVICCAPPPSGIIAWWPAVDTHDVVGTNDGTLHGSAGYTAGMVGAAFDVYGGVSGITLPPDALNLAFSALTIEAWVRPEAHGHDTSGTYGYTIFSTTQGDGYALRVRDGCLQPDLRLTGGTSRPLFTQAKLPLNVWSHVAVTYDGSRVRGYLNGELLGSASASGTIRNTSNHGILSTIGNEAGFSGIESGNFGWRGGLTSCPFTIARWIPRKSPPFMPRTARANAGIERR